MGFKIRKNILTENRIIIEVEETITEVIEIIYNRSEEISLIKKSF